MKRIALLSGATLLFSLPGSSSQRLDEALQSITAPETEEAVVAQEPEPEPEPQVKKWAGKNFTEEETIVLNFLQERGITDRAALATILGNIKQESRFDTIICEGGRRTGYHNCHSGGFGLIQWTTVGRYNGLGSFARNYGLNPNELVTQLRYMVNEKQWTSNEHIWKTPGKSIGQYMNAAYRWLGWGIHGARTTYANQYFQALYRG
jgi:hypothetical protein